MFLLYISLLWILNHVVIWSRAAEDDAYMSLASESHSTGQSTLCWQSSVSLDSHPDFRAHGQQPRSVGSPRSHRSSIQTSGLIDSPCSAVGSPRALESPWFSANPSFVKPPQVWIVESSGSGRKWFLGLCLVLHVACFKNQDNRGICRVIRSLDYLSLSVFYLFLCSLILKCAQR